MARFSFADCLLDTDRRELRRRGAAVSVEPQVFDLVELLVRQRHRVVTRDDLIDGVWKGRIVSESTLATRINAARQVIGDDGTRQALIRTVQRRGLRFVGEVTEEGASEPEAGTEAAVPAQAITFRQTGDGVNIAIGTAGEGPLLVKTANWLNHIEQDWQSPIWSALFTRLAGRFRLVRYDGRGNGLSDHEVADISFDGFVRDLETVADDLAPPFTLLGLSQGAATAIAYAVRHPERVSRLILYGAYARGRNQQGDADARERAATMLAMIRQGWGDESSAFMRAFSSLYLPNGTPEQIRWFADLQRATTSADLAARLRQACDDIDVAALLPHVRVPTLVMHARDDNVVSFEQGRAIAAAVPGAAFVSLDSENHVPLPGEPAWARLVAEIETFAAGG